MTFSKTTEYALRIAGFMAIDDKKIYSTNEIFEALHIPFRYLRKLMTILTKTSLIESIQGKFGGYKLGKKPEDISLFDIVMATDDSFQGNTCFFGYKTCALDHFCVMHTKWDSVRTNVANVLKTTSLKDLKESGQSGI